MQTFLDGKRIWEVFQTQFDAWSAMQPQDKKSAHDYIVWMAQHIDQQEAASAICERFKDLGMDGLYQAWKTRRAADDRLLEVVVDRMMQAKAEAEFECHADISALQKSNALLKESVEKANAKLEKTKSELEEVKVQYQELVAEKIDLESEKAELFKSGQNMKASLEAATAASEKTKHELEQERLSTIDLREKLLVQENRVNVLQKNLDEAELAHTLKLKELEAERDQLAARLDQEQKHRQESEKIIKELEQAKLKIAAMEATIAAQKENLANIISVGRFIATAEGEPNRT